MKTIVQKVVESYHHDGTRLMDILIDIQGKIGFLPQDIVRQIANELKMSEVDVEQTISFYHFFAQKPKGKYAIYLNNSAVANMMGREKVAKAFEKEVGCKFGEVSHDGLIGLYDTACIGMNDQEPAAIINGTVFTRLTTFRVKELVRDIKSGKKVEEMLTASYGDGNNNSEFLKTTVYNNIRKKGPILSPDYTPGDTIRKIITLTPEEVIQEVKISNIRGRGGAGFPTGMKWEFCRKAQGETRYIFCNADEGEPGTFKDRVILTERPRLLFEGMVVAGYAVGSTQGILYLRYEYKYLGDYLEHVLQELRDKNLLGENICGKDGFNFDIRIQFGAGAYVCGEESALIESAEGKRGEPRDRPPFPVEKGYLQQPTIVNNVETLCAVTKILLHGGEWYKAFGTKDSTGTKLLCISGDCLYPGVYEVEWGFNINDIIEMVGADEVQAVQVGGPSGACIAPKEFARTLCYADLSTGGSLIILGKNRDLLNDIVLNFTEFFIEESCGACVTCRSMTLMLKQKLEKILHGHGVKKDLDDMVSWGKIMKASRCGLGHTAANPIISTIKNFRELYESRMDNSKKFDSGFDLFKAIEEAAKITGRNPKKEGILAH